jgi:hypothetical protein
VADGFSMARRYGSRSTECVPKASYGDEFRYISGVASAQHHLAALADEEYEPYARNAEGQLLKGYRRFHGKLPLWNGVGGSRRGAMFVRHKSGWWVDSMTSADDSMVVARRTIRELSDDATAEYFENCVHMARTQLANIDGTNPDQIAAAIQRAIEWRAGPPLSDTELAERLRTYFGQPAPHPERF